MNSPNRDQFEASLAGSGHFAGISHEDLFARRDDGDYKMIAVRSGWIAWQLSHAHFEPLVEACAFLAKAENNNTSGATNIYRDAIDRVVQETCNLTGPATQY